MAGLKSTNYLVACAICKVEFGTTKYKLLRNKQHFCSKSCYVIGHERVELICETCGSNFSIRKSDSERGKGQFCSQPCRYGTPKDRFWGRVRKTDSCWLWTGRVSVGGYGKTYLGGKIIPAHRFSWTLANGPIPDGMFVCHKCDNPPCVRPDHLFLGTNADNMADCAAKGRIARGEKNGAAKLTSSQVQEIREMARLGLKHKDIAERFAIHASYVWMIVSGRWRRHA